MQAIQRALRKSLILSLVLTLCLPLGGVLLGVGLGIGQPAVGGSGIAFLGIGFYGTPVGWAIAYAPKKTLARIVSAVTEEHLYTVGEIAAQLSLSEKDVRTHLDTCFQKQYLPGFVRQGDTLLLNENQALGKQLLTADCPACGARFSYSRDKAFCPYCGTPVRREKP